MSVLADAAAGSCALVFLAAVVGKLDRWSQWSRLTDEFPWQPVFGRAARFVVPAIEGAVVVLSLAVSIVGLASAALVLAGFALAAIFLSRRLAGRECNCFGAIAPATINRRLAARNVMLALAATAGWYAARQANVRALPLSSILLVLLVGVIGLMLLQHRRLQRAARPTSPRPREAE